MNYFLSTLSLQIQTFIFSFKNQELSEILTVSVIDQQLLQNWTLLDTKMHKKCYH